MIKKTVAAALALTTLFAGCVGISFSDHSEFGQVNVTASGEIIAAEFSFENFTKLTVNIPGELYYIKGEPGNVKIEASESLMEYLDVYNDNGAVVVDATGSFNINSDRHNPKIYVTAPLLECLNANGLVNLKEADKITAESFTLTVGGVFNGTLDFAVKSLSADLSGVGNLTLAGTADKAVINSSGAVNLSAFDLQLKEASVNSSGVGKVEVNCSDTLVADISGAGGVMYKGSPNVTPNVSGIGRLKKAD